MTKDIVEKILRQHELSIFNPEQMAIFDLPDDEFVTWKDAADEIERLREENQQYLDCFAAMANAALTVLKPRELKA